MFDLSFFNLLSFDLFSTESISNKKRDITLKHSDDLSLSKKLKFKNITQIKKIFLLSENNIKIMTNRIIIISQNNNFIIPENLFKKWNRK